MAPSAAFAITVAPPALDELCINTLRFLAVDMVQKAKSGHPGLPLGSAAMAYTLWDRFLKFNPRDPFWPDRDRFVLSAGHGCALLYALLHVTGFDLPLEELESVPPVLLLPLLLLLLLELSVELPGAPLVPLGLDGSLGLPVAPDPLGRSGMAARPPAPFCSLLT